MYRRSRPPLISVIVDLFAIWGLVSCLFITSNWIENRVQRYRDRVSYAATHTYTTALPTFTPYPASQDAVSKVEKLLKDSTQCPLPCWWGLTPGKTSLDEMHAFLSPLVKVNSAAFPNDPNIFVGADLNSLKPGMPILGLGFQNEILQSISVENIRAGYTTQYELDSLFKIYGKPDEVCALTQVVDTATVKIQIGLYYYDKGIVVRSWYEGNTKCCRVHASLSRAESISLLLWDPARQRPAEYQVTNGCNPTSANLLPVASVSDLSVQAFYDRFIAMKPGQDWFETSTEYWYP